MGSQPNIHVVALVLCWLICALPAAHTFAQTAPASESDPTTTKMPDLRKSVSERTPDETKITSSMTEAVNSALRMDWTMKSQLNEQQQSTMDCTCKGQYIDPPNYGPEANMEPEDAPLRLISDQANFADNNRVSLSGDVEVYQGKRRLRCDTIEIDQANETATLSGNVQLREPGLLLIGASAQLNNRNGTAYIDQASYVVHDNHLRGRATKVLRESEHIIVLEDGEYTSCEPAANDWHLRASEIELNQETGFGRAKHARIYVKEVPIFYFPYMEFPINDNRKSGLLWPVFSRTKNGGVDLAVPYYLNLAPHYDMTLTPRYVNTHGLLSELEMRYLNKFSHWTVGGTFLDGDKRYEDLDPASQGEDSTVNPLLDEFSVDSKRWSALIKETGRFDDFWHSDINYSAVSDDLYFRDLGTTGLDISRSVQLKRRAGLYYSSPQWSLNAVAEDYQTLLDVEDVDTPYSIAPRITLKRRSALGSSGIEPSITAQYSFFEHATNPRAQRIYAAPGLSYSYRGLAGYITPSVKVKHIQYVLNHSNQDSESEFHSRFDDVVTHGSHDVTAPTFTLDSKLFFERDLAISGQSYLQTLEPRLFYVYTDFQDQRDLPVFDTIATSFSANSLFREERFVGYDRIGDANQAAFEISSALFNNDSGQKVFTASIGQLFYFRDRLVTTGTSELEETDTLSPANEKRYFRASSDIATRLQWQPSEQLQFQTDHIWDPYNDTTSSAALHFRYYTENYNIFNFSYRFNRKNNQPENNNSQLFRRAEPEDTEQIDVSAVFPLNKQWSFISRWNYDLSEDRTIEDITGLEYNDCCWRARLVYQRERDSIDLYDGIESGANIDAEPLGYDFVIMLQVELKGLGGISGGVTGLLEESILGFRQREDNYR